MIGEKTHLEQRVNLLGSFAALAAAVAPVSSAYAAPASAGTCPGERTVAVATGEACAFVVALKPIAVTRKPTDIYYLPEQVVIKLIPPPIGTIAQAAYKQQQRGTSTFTLSPPPELSSYQRVSETAVVWSRTKNVKYGFMDLTSDSATFYVTTDRPGFGEGREWLKADVVVVFVHPSILSNTRPLEIEALVRRGLDELAKYHPQPKEPYLVRGEGKPNPLKETYRR